MMTSFAENIKPIIESIVEVNPKRILDIGSAFGKFSILAREAILSIRAEGQDLTPVDDLEIDCIEMAKYFQNQPYHANLYQKHWHMDAREIDWLGMPEYDLILLIDVIEHWNKEEAKKIIEELKKYTKAKILISTPKEVAFYKEEYYGADCPKHISQWIREDFEGIDKSTEKSHIFII
jgi:2-polyprenyl-3-methyl-5-hydroxy-6-metoxy-1,4-benzoquinol methylase